MKPGFTPLLSILMPTMVKREERFLPLVGGILAQAESCPWPVEVVGLQNQGQKTIAEYREMLLRDARGDYVCFVDDDDAVSDDYVPEICAALTRDPDDAPDVVSFYQRCTGTPAELTMFGLQYLGVPWHPLTVNGMLTYLRTFSHVQPLRAEVARQGTFLRKGSPGYTQEDQHFAHTVVPILLRRGSREVRVPKVLYTYQWMSTGESTQQGRQRDPAEDHELPKADSPCFRWYDE